MSKQQLSMFEPIEVPLTKGYVALIDPIDSDLASLSWIADDSYRAVIYAKRRGPHGQVRLHRVILARVLDRPLLPAEVVDHIDGNGLNNRRSNLRVATKAENGRNRKLNKNNTSGYRGVYWSKKNKNWTAQIRAGDRKLFLGSFDTAQEAHNAYCEAAKQLHGEFARTR